MTTLFTKIINRELPAAIVYESPQIIVIKDIKPIAPIHLLLISKKPIPNLQAVEASDAEIVLEIITVAQQLAKELHMADNYRLITNNGSLAGQQIFHLHFHLIGGFSLTTSLKTLI